MTNTNDSDKQIDSEEPIDYQRPPLAERFIEKDLHIIAISAFVLWMIAGFTPALDDEVGFMAWFYGMLFIPPLGIFVTMANGHLLIATIDAFRYFDRERVTLPKRYPIAGLVGIAITLTFMIADILGPKGSGSSDPSIPEPEFTFGAYIYMASLLLCLFRMAILVWRRASDSPV